MRVIRLGADDILRYRPLRLRALELAPDAFGSTLAQERDQPEGYWRARSERAHATLLAVTDEGDDVGICVLAGAARSGDVGLYSMWVEPRARGMGAGDALVSEAIEVARELGAARVVLEVADTNAPAIGLYARRGFVPTGAVGAMPPPREHITETEMAYTL
jgi:ribosomal protein S18 acetylase RimI-like enzyme